MLCPSTSKSNTTRCGPVVYMRSCDRLGLHSDHASRRRPCLLRDPIHRAVGSYTSYSLTAHHNTPPPTSVTAVLICRFLINVQEVNKKTVQGYETWFVDASLPQSHTELRFADVRISGQGSRERHSHIVDINLNTPRHIPHMSV